MGTSRRQGATQEAGSNTATTPRIARCGRRPNTSTSSPSLKSCRKSDQLQYRDEAGELRGISSSDVNAYLKETADTNITAKDFRTWAGSVLAARWLAEMDPFESVAQANRNLRSAIARVAVSLGNTPTTCRKRYIHPAVLSAYLDSEVIAPATPLNANGSVDRIGLRAEEIALLALLRARAK